MTIGRPAISTRCVMGSSMVRGRSERILAIASFTSFTARSELIPSRNSIVVVERPSAIVDVMCLTPLMPATASSTRFVTWLCSSDGAAPDCVTVTETSGRSMFGKRVIDMFRKLNTPRIVSTMKSTIEGIGFRIDQAETLSCIGGPDHRAVCA